MARVHLAWQRSECVCLRRLKSWKKLKKQAKWPLISRHRTNYTSAFKRKTNKRKAFNKTMS